MNNRDINWNERGGGGEVRAAKMRGMMDRDGRDSL